MTRVWNFEPEYILTVEPTNRLGTVECRSKIIFFLGLKTSLLQIKKTLRQVAGAK